MKRSGKDCVRSFWEIGKLEAWYADNSTLVHQQFLSLHLILARATVIGEVIDHCLVLEQSPHFHSALCQRLVAHRTHLSSSKFSVCHPAQMVNICYILSFVTPSVQE